MLFVFWQLLSYLLALLAHNLSHQATLDGVVQEISYIRMESRSLPPVDGADVQLAVDTYNSGPGPLTLRDSKPHRSAGA